MRICLANITHDSDEIYSIISTYGYCQILSFTRKKKSLYQLWEVLGFLVFFS